MEIPDFRAERDSERDQEFVLFMDATQFTGFNKESIFHDQGYNTLFWSSGQIGRASCRERVCQYV